MSGTEGTVSFVSYSISPTVSSAQHFRHLILILLKLTAVPFSSTLNIHNFIWKLHSSSPASLASSRFVVLCRLRQVIFSTQWETFGESFPPEVLEESQTIFEEEHEVFCNYREFPILLRDLSHINTTSHIR